MIEPLVFQFGLLVAGLGVLRATRIVAPLSPTSALRSGGLGYLVGVAVVMQIAVLLLVLGVPFDLPVVAFIIVVCASPLLLDLRRMSVPFRLSRPSHWSRSMLPRGEPALVVLVLSCFAAFAIVGFVTLANQPVLGYDAWNEWSRKAVLMFFDSHLPLGVLKSTSGGYINPDYPLVLSLLEAVHLRTLHRYELSSVNTIIWALGVAFVWAGIDISSRVIRPALAALLFCGVLFLVLAQLLTAYADVPLAFYLGLSVLTLGIWIESRRRQDLGLALLLLAGAAGIKDEGIIGSVALVAAGLMTLLAARRPRQAVELMVGFVAMALLAIVPWHLWLIAHGIKSGVPFPGGLSPVFLIDHDSRVWPAVTGLYPQLTSLGSLAVFIPLGITIVLVRLRVSRRQPLVWFYLLAGGFYFLALVWALWVGPIAIAFMVATSVNRIFIGVAMIAMVAVLHLSGLEAQTDEVRDATTPGSTRPPALPA